MSKQHQTIMRRLNALMAYARTHKINLAFIMEDDKGYMHTQWAGDDEWAIDAGEYLTAVADDAFHEKLYYVDDLLDNIFDNENQEL